MNDCENMNAKGGKGREGKYATSTQTRPEVFMNRIISIDIGLPQTTICFAVPSEATEAIRAIGVRMEATVPPKSRAYITSEILFT
jgi:hypothetical protein